MAFILDSEIFRRAGPTISRLATSVSRDISMSVSFLVAADTNRDERLGYIIAQAAPGLNVMNSKAFDRPATLTTPAVSFQNLAAEPRS